MHITDKLNKHKLLFEKLDNKVKKYKKTFSIFEKLRFNEKKGEFVKKDQLFFSFLFSIVFSIGLTTLNYGLFLSFFSNNHIFSGFTFIFISVPFFYLGFITFIESLFFIKIFFKKLSKKEIVTLQKYGIKNINNINNILIYTLKRTKLKKEEFSDIIEIYNTYQSEIDTPVIFNIIKEKIINMYSEKEISKNELQTYTKYFMDNLNIANKTIIRDSYLDIEKITFNNHENLFKEKQSILF
tara:strand:- start:3149 stop:3868 length:720 start_codon:yes stop_codon:yes gene_type:complete